MSSVRWRSHNKWRHWRGSILNYRYANVTFPFLKEKAPFLLRLIGSIPIPRVDCWQNSVTRNRNYDTPKIRILLPKVPKWQPSAVDWMMSPFSGFARRHCHWKRPLWPNWLIRPHYIEDIQKILIPRLHPGSFNQFQHEKGYLNILRWRWHLKKGWVAVSSLMLIAIQMFPKDHDCKTWWRLRKNVRKKQRGYYHRRKGLSMGLRSESIGGLQFANGIRRILIS